MDKIFITGSTGFIGTNLRNYLASYDHEVVGVSRIKNSEKITLNYNDFEQDLILGGKSVIHLAGKAHDLKNITDKETYFEINYGLTKRVFDAFLNSEAEVFIYMSTVKAVKDVVSGILNEDAIPEPTTFYGQSKLKAEEYILANLPQNKRIYILRPCIIHGPGNKGNLNLLYQFISKGFPWPLGKFENQRSFLSIENLSFVIKELVENKNIPTGIYQVADEQTLSTNELIRLLGSSLKKNCKIWNIPLLWVKGAAFLGDMLHLPLNTERLQKLTENYVVSNGKVIAAIGKSLPVSTKEGLLKTFESFHQL